MNRRLIAAVCVVLSLGMSGPAAFAHGEIVYGARYYLRPGSRGLSHYHVYRIDPDGRNRVQLTFGNADDVLPAWTAR